MIALQGARVSYKKYLSAPVMLDTDNIDTTAFEVNWVEVEGATGYILDVNTEAIFEPDRQIDVSPITIAGGDTINHTVSTNLFPGNTYYYRLRAINANSISGISRIIEVTTKLSAPVMSAASDITDETFTANWGVVAGATRYYLEINTEDDFEPITEWIDIEGGATITYAVHDLMPDTAYHYRLYAANANSTSEASGAMKVITQLSAPVMLPAVDVTSDTFTAHWEAVKGAISYSLDVNTAGDFGRETVIEGSPITIAGGDSLKYVVSIGLSPDTTYYCRLYAVNKNSTSEASNTMTVTTRSK